MINKFKVYDEIIPPTFCSNCNKEQQKFETETLSLEECFEGDLKDGMPNLLS